MSETLRDALVSQFSDFHRLQCNCYAPRIDEACVRLRLAVASRLLEGGPGEEEIAKMIHESADVNTVLPWEALNDQSMTKEKARAAARFIREHVVWVR